MHCLKSVQVDKALQDKEPCFKNLFPKIVILYERPIPLFARKRKRTKTLFNLNFPNVVISHFSIIQITY